MVVRLHTLTLRASDPEASAEFWAGLLGQDRHGWSLAPAEGTPFGLAFIEAYGPVTLPTQVHLHLSSNTTTQVATVTRALGLGAAHVDVGQLPDEDHVVLADPDGVPFCVIEEGNGWLTGTPFLGEIGCDGTREVGVFWSEALGWPLVHDEDGETAIQPPHGGPKIAWGGPPLDERRGPGRMYFDLVADDLETEVARLCGLGATEVARNGEDVEMSDPDGNEFHLRRVSA